MTIKVVVPISGGKDSQACAKLAVETFGSQNVRGLFCDTKFEHDLTYAHIEKISDMYDIQIDTINEGSVEEKVIQHKRFPAPLIRFCTNELKIIPSKKYYKALSEKQGGFEVWYGMRSSESTDRKKRYKGKVSNEIYTPNEVSTVYPKYLGKKGVRFRLPIIDWSREEVMDYLEKTENPLYKMGMDRVGCFPCLAGGKKSISNALNADAFGSGQKVKIQRLEDAIGKKHEHAQTNQICMFCQI